MNTFWVQIVANLEFKSSF